MISVTNTTARMDVHEDIISAVAGFYLSYMDSWIKLVRTEKHPKAA